MTFRSVIWTVAKIIVGVVLTILALGAGYFVVYPRVDEAIRYGRVGTRLGTEGTWEAVAARLDETLVAGLTPDQVHSILEKAGPIELRGGTHIVDAEGIYLDVCSYAPNNMWIRAEYSADGKLRRVRFLSDSL